MMRARRSGGFTLIEILVVVVIIGVMIGLASVHLMRSPGDLVREESEHTNPVTSRSSTARSNCLRAR